MDKEKKFRQWRSNQGRSPERMKNIYKSCFVILLAGFVTFIATLIYSII